jgi:hypothetical protein
MALGGAGAVREIEQRPEFIAGAVNAVKLIMAEEGWSPALTSDGRQDQGRLDHLRVKPRWFTHDGAALFTRVMSHLVSMQAARWREPGMAAGRQAVRLELTSMSR